MSDERFAESGALLAIIRGDDIRAMELIKDMLTGERLNLVDAADRLAEIAHPGNTCLRCGEFVEREGSQKAKSPDGRWLVQRWHRVCYEQTSAGGGRRG